ARNAASRRRTSSSGCGERAGRSRSWGRRWPASRPPPTTRRLARRRPSSASSTSSDGLPTRSSSCADSEYSETQRTDRRQALSRRIEHQTHALESEDAEATFVDSRATRLVYAAPAVVGSAEMAITIETPQGTDALTEFVRFQDAVYAERSARWPALPPLQLPMLAGESPFAEGRTLHPLLARDGGRILARALAVLDGRYNRHWNERLGHVLMFEARPGTREATRLLLDAACEWLEEHGAEAARAGFGMLELPFVIDDYDSLPPSILRHHPAYYHAPLKDAGFESEHGMVDYKIHVRAELVARWESALEAVRRAGYEIVPLAEVPEGRRASEFTELWNDGFKAHWGYTPFSQPEIALL